MSEQLLVREQHVGRLEALARMLAPWNPAEIFYRKERDALHRYHVRCVWLYPVGELGARQQHHLSAPRSFSRCFSLSMLGGIRCIQCKQMNQAAAAGTVLLPPVLARK